MDKKIILLLFILLSMITIFVFSSKNSDKSNSTSKNLINKSIIVYEIVTNKKVDREVVINKLNYPIRKLAHFTLYFILGLFVYSLFKLITDKYWVLLTLIITISYAALDEYHQMFVSGRTSQVKDVLIDTCGSICAIVLLKIISEGKNRGLK